jgi:hypothetical protein
VPSEGQDTAQLRALFAWNDSALQDRFSSSIQYLKGGRRYGFLNFQGELALNELATTLITSGSVGKSRRELLHAALQQPHLIAEAMDPTKLRESLRQPELAAKIDDYLQETFEQIFFGV